MGSEGLQRLADVMRAARDRPGEPLICLPWAVRKPRDQAVELRHGGRERLGRCNNGIGELRLLLHAAEASCCTVVA
jgi:hypothetical protein